MAGDVETKRVGEVDRPHKDSGLAVVIALFALIVSAGQAWLTNQSVDTNRRSALALRRLDACATVDSLSSQIQQLAHGEATRFGELYGFGGRAGSPKVLKDVGPPVYDLNDYGAQQADDIGKEAALLDLLGPDPLAADAHGIQTRVSRLVLDRVEMKGAADSYVNATGQEIATGHNRVASAIGEALSDTVLLQEERATLRTHCLAAMGSLRDIR